LQLDWSQLNVDASTLTIGPVSRRVRHKRGRQRKCRGHSNDKPNGSAALSVKQPLSPFWDARRRRRHDRRPAAGDADDVRTVIEKLAKRRRPAAILRSGMGGDDGPRRRLDLGQDGDRSPVDPSQEQSKLGTP